ncbi:IS1 family transposase, partial [Escherichia coli]|uniref:IS1 family transposase n=8 Tax=Escherichia coli TaxID=562 RepID=UPI002040D89B
DPGPVFHTIVSIKNDGHYFCRAGGNRPDGLNEPVTIERHNLNLRQHLARLGRKSLSFSKSVELHDKVIGHYLNIKHYQ